MTPLEPLFDRFDRLIRLCEQALAALGRIESRLNHAPAANEASNELWDVADTATFLKCSKSKVYQQAQAGKMPCFHVGGQLRFDPEAIRRWARGEESGGNVVSLPSSVGPRR